MNSSRWTCSPTSASEATRSPCCPMRAASATREMQAIAAEFNLSETTFVLPPENPAHTAQGPHLHAEAANCPSPGHPNVGTGYVLARRLGEGIKRLVFEERAGIVNVAVLHDDCACRDRRRDLRAAIAADRHRGRAAETVARLRRARRWPTSPRHAHTPLVASVGTEFVIAELASMEALRRASPDPAALPRRAAHVRRRGAARRPAALRAPGWRRDAPRHAHVRPARRHHGGSRDRQRQRGARRPPHLARARATRSSSPSTSCRASRWAARVASWRVLARRPKGRSPRMSREAACL